MFPDNIQVDTIETVLTYNVETSNTAVKTPDFDWEKKCISIYNGLPVLIDNVSAIKKWIILFLHTPIGVYKIYKNLPFGTSVKKLFGRKRLNNGYEESELEREIREGLLLCPAIKRVADYNLRKNGRNLCIDLSVELYDGSLIKVNEENVYTIK